MASLQIPEHLEDELQIAAEWSGRTKEEVAAEILSAHFEDESLPLSAFTEEQLARLLHSIEQVKRGEVITSEQVQQKFADWAVRRASR
jgi:predicted transcriptional regulator